MAVGVRSVPLPSESNFYTWQKDGITYGIRLQGEYRKRAQGASISEFTVGGYLRDQFKLIRDGEDVHCAYNYQSYVERLMGQTLARADVAFLHEPFLLKTMSRDRR